MLSFSRKYDNWMIHPRCAIGEKSRKTFINISGNDGMSSSILEMGEKHIKSAPKSIYIGKQKVEVITIDSIFKKYYKKRDKVLLKIDVQGFEDQVIEGAKLSLNDISAIKLELSLANLYEGDKIYKYYLDKIESLGFVIWDLQPGFRDKSTGRLLQFDAIFVREEYY